MRIYLSYGRRDSQDFTKRLSSWLRLFGHDPWLDVEQEIPVDTLFDQRTEAAIRECDVVLALSSPESVWPEGICEHELHYAQSLKIAILPVLLADIARPIEFLTINSLDAITDPKSVFTILPDILRHIEQKAEPQKITPAGTRGRPGKPRRISLQENLKNYGSRFTGRDWLFDQIRSWADKKDSRILILSGEPGIGKSALCARLITRMDVKGIYFFNPSDKDSCLPGSLIEAFTFQFASQFPSFCKALETISRTDPSSPPELLFRMLVTDPLLACTERPDTKSPWVVVIDGLDEAYAVCGPEMTEFLAESLERFPPWFRVIATTKPDYDILARFRGKGIHHMTLDASSVDNRADLAEYIDTRVKGWELVGLPDIVSYIGNIAAGNFRYAKAALDAQTIPNYSGRLICEERGTFPGILYKQYERMFRDRFRDIRVYRKEIAPYLACLAIPQKPVPETLLLSAFEIKRRMAIREYVNAPETGGQKAGTGSDHQAGEPDNAVAPETPVPVLHSGKDRQEAVLRLRILSPFLVQDGDGVRLFHPSFAEWLSETWGENPFGVAQKEGFRRLAEACLQEVRMSKGELPRHVLTYIAWYLVQSGKYDKLAEILMNSRYVAAACKRDRDGFLVLLALIENVTPLRIPEVYAPVLEAPSRYDPAFVEIVARFLKDTGHHTDAMDLFGKLESVCTEKKDMVRAAGALSQQASIRHYRGNLNGAMSLLKKAVRTQRKCKDWKGLAASLASQGSILHTKGDLTAAIKIFKEQENISRDNGDWPGVMHAMSSEALVHRSLGHFENAKKIFAILEEGRRKYWLRSEVARASGIRALVHLDQGEFVDALRLLSEKKMLCTQLGDWIGVANCIANEGFIRTVQGESIEAIILYKEQERICREHDDQYGLVSALGNQGVIYLAKGDLIESMNLFQEQETISRNLIYPRGLAVSFANQALVHNRQKNFKRAFRLAGAALSIAQEQGYANLAEKIRAILEEITPEGED